MPALRTAKGKIHHPKSACLLTLTVLAPRRPTQSIELWAGDTGAKVSHSRRKMMCQTSPNKPFSHAVVNQPLKRLGDPAQSSSLLPVVKNNFVGGSVIVCQYYALQREKHHPKSACLLTLKVLAPRRGTMVTCDPIIRSLVTLLSPVTCDPTIRSPATLSL